LINGYSSQEDKSKSSCKLFQTFFKATGLYPTNELIDHLYLNCVRKIRELREQHADILANRKAEAEDAQKLVSSAAERKTKMEAGKKDGKNGGGSKEEEGWYAHTVPAYMHACIHDNPLTIGMFFV
jgi:hypothetical protein